MLLRAKMHQLNVSNEDANLCNIWKYVNNSVLIFSPEVNS